MILEIQFPTQHKKTVGAGHCPALFIHCFLPLGFPDPTDILGQNTVLSLQQTLVEQVTCLFCRLDQINHEKTYQKILTPGRKQNKL